MPEIDRRVWRVKGDPLVAAVPRSAGHGAPAALDGQTVAVKDLFAVAGQRIGAGVPGYLAEALVQPVSASAVQRLIDGGASVIGIAQTDEFAFSLAGANPHYGSPPNPAVPGGLPGGSSSGPASAVALGEATIGLATDTAGSIRVPASYQGLWGLRTTHGAVPRDGLLPLAAGFDTVGWLTRSPALLLRVAVQQLPEAAMLQVGIPPAMRFAIDPTLLTGVDPGVAAAFVAFVRYRLGGEVDEVAVGDTAESADAFRIAQAFEAWACHGAWLTAHPGAVSGAVSARFDAAHRVTAAEASESREILAAARGRLTALLAARVLLLPSTATTAPSLTAEPPVVEHARARTVRLTHLASVLGGPAVSAPLLTVNGAPLGISLVALPGRDVELLRLAATLAADAGQPTESPTDR
ncbi:amidase family protein [uncultured Amnibacterium sp.]|uniref:amidase family protein n=1 Tax=uncultured Amnibacterium sp. TaxID=1631851 RepID=UPI0035CC5D72